MKDEQVRIVEMKDQKVALAHGTGKEIGEPEEEAWDKLMRWIKEEDVLEEKDGFQLFGRNNPPPTEENEEYGYDQMVTLYNNYESTENIEITEIEGGSFAVTRFKNLENIVEKWQELYEWVQNNDEYEIAGHGLEELLSSPEELVPEKMIFDLWLPINKS